MPKEHPADRFSSSEINADRAISNQDAESDSLDETKAPARPQEANDPSDMVEPSDSSDSRNEKNKAAFDSAKRAAAGAAVGGAAAYGAAAAVGLTATATAATTVSAAPAAFGAVTGLGMWAAAGALINAIGFGVGGVASGSVAASMMSASAVASGGGVLSGSAVAVLQSIGAVGGLSNPVGLGLVGAGTAISLGASYVLAAAAPVAAASTSVAAVTSMAAGAGAVIGAAVIPAAKSLKSYLHRPNEDLETKSENNGKGLWVLVEMLADSGNFRFQTFDIEDDGRDACMSSLVSSALFDPGDNLVLAYGHDVSMRSALAEYRNQSR